MPISPWKYAPFRDHQIICPVEFDFSGADTSIPFFTPDAMPQIFGNDSSTTVAVVKKLFIMYTEATPGSGSGYTNIIRLGTDTNSSAAHDFTPPFNKAAGDVDVIDQSDFSAEPRVFNSTNWLQIRCVGGASSTGKAYVGAVLSFDIRDWTGYTFG